MEYQKITNLLGNTYDKVPRCITKKWIEVHDQSGGTYNTEDLDIVIPMYNLIEYSKNYRKTTGSLWNYYRDQPNSGAVGNINYFIKNSRSFNYKTSITGKLEGNNVEKDDVEIIVPLKYLTIFGEH